MTIHHAANLADQTGIAHGFFDREGGVSTGLYASLNCGPGSSDDAESVRENRVRVVAALDESAKLVTLAQIHSPNVRVIGADWDWSNRQEGDAMVTARPGVILGILTADCAPILFADQEAGVIGAAHAGWKGALGKNGVGVLEATILAMEKLGATRISAAIGPTIGQGDYEVGADFHAAFAAVPDLNGDAFFAPAPRPGHFLFNLPAYVAMRLKRAGIADIADLGLSTYPPGNGFFSFRRATHAKEPDYGRQISALMLKS